MKNRNRILKSLILGLLGAALWMASDWMIGAYGDGNIRNGLIESNWAKMPMWRFRAALFVSAAAAPLIFSGMKASVTAMRVARRKRYITDYYMERLYELGAYCTATGFLFVMAVRVIIPILYKSLFATRLMGAEIISTVESVFYYVSIPFFIFYVVMIVAASLGFIYFVLIGRLLIPKLFFIFNPMVFWLLGFILKQLNVAFVNDFVAAAASLGYLAMIACIITFVTHIPVRKKKRVR